MSDVAKMMNVSVSTVCRYVNLFYSTRDIEYMLVLWVRGYYGSQSFKHIQ